MDARRKIEHTVDGKIVEKISIETGGTDENGNEGVPLEISASNDVIAEVTDRVFAEQCLAILSNEDRDIITRYASGRHLSLLQRLLVTIRRAVCRNESSGYGNLSDKEWENNQSYGCTC
jgi:hypothetical protein